MPTPGTADDDALRDDDIGLIEDDAGGGGELPLFEIDGLEDGTEPEVDIDRDIDIASLDEGDDDDELDDDDDNPYGDSDEALPDDAEERAITRNLEDEEDEDRDDL